ncbi:DUF4328 domain-containing protein [Sphingomonas colocasiae]|uniref:DUF4328 domain-containing protein n=1 Tax=Sphingomonas colocasiae TaxID=1848973 RepID=A0ABS7PRW5_9SPHN|nr:DUF4328 domain-containing protein [Sphingomonas colocasiae]MBY8824078.1 DUF4328 domain-containing protein [Sphingomonas colocasiae]
MSDQYAFRDQRGLAKACLVLLYIQAGVAVFGIASAWWTYDLLSRASVHMPVGSGLLEADNVRAMFVSVLGTFLYIVGGIAVLTWIYSASRRAHLVGALEMTVTPGWAVAWYFVPIANLFMPFRAMREIDEASASALPGEDDRLGGEGMLLGWWGSWLAMNMTAWVSFRLSMNGVTVDDLRTAALFDLISFLLTIPACLLLAAIIARIQSFQNRAAPID